MERRSIGLAAALGVLAVGTTPQAALSDNACADAIRAIMTDTRQDRPAVMHTNTTLMNGAETRNTSWSTGFNQGLNTNAAGVPESLFRDGAFFFTTNGGESWTLSRAYSDEEVQAIIDGMQWQAANAESFTCDEGAEYEGRAGNRYEVVYTLSSTQGPARTVYWLDPETQFIWRTENTFGSGESAMQVIQDTEPAPSFVLPDPGQ